MITEVEAEVRKDIVKTGYKEFLKGNFNHDVRGKFEELDANVMAEIKNMDIRLIQSMFVKFQHILLLLILQRS